MALPSFFKRKNPPPAPLSASDPLGDDTGPVQAARTRARRRLVGAVVLLAIGVVVFPMLFETQPRPLPGDIPIELPRRDGPPARTAALPRNAPAVTVLPPVSEPAAPPATHPAAEPPGIATPAAAPQGDRAAAENAKAEPPKAEPARPDAAKAEAARPEPPKAPASRPEAPQPADTRKAESDRARALLEGRSAAATPAASEPRNGRYVVQVGAYTDAATLREVRAKVEKLGLKTYTQTIETEAGKRTRVRVGPFATRQEADSASGRLKGAGLPGNVLTL